MHTCTTNWQENIAKEFPDLSEEERYQKFNASWGEIVTSMEQKGFHRPILSGRADCNPFR